MSEEIKIQEDKPKQQDNQSKQALFEIFKKFDKDSSGSIDYQEIGQVAKELNIEINEKEVMQIFKDLDVNGDKHIDFEEFYQWWQIGRPNKLEKLVFYKLKAQKLWKKASADFTRLGTSLEDKYGKIDSYQLTLNLCDYESKFKVAFLALIEHQDYKEEIKSITRGITLIKPAAIQQDEEQMKQQQQSHIQPSSYNMVLRFPTLNVVELHQQLQKDIDAYFATVAAQKGPEVAEQFKQLMPINIQSTDTDVVIVGQLNQGLIDGFLQSQELQVVQELSKKSNVKLELELSLKNSLHDLLHNPEKIFVKWLLNGFRFHLKFSANTDLVKKIKELVKQWATQMLHQEEDEIQTNQEMQNNLAITMILTLLDSFKFSLNFKNQDHVDEVFKGLGIDTMAADQPSNEQLFKEISQITGINEWKNESKDEQGYSEHSYHIMFIETLAKYCSDQASLSFFTNNKIFQFNFKALGLGEILTYMINQDNKK